MIVGCGEVSRLYAHCLAGNARGLFVTAVCDVNAAAAAALAAEIDGVQRGRAYGAGAAPACVATASLDELFRTVPPARRRIAVNLTPPEHHYETNRRLLSDGRCHVWSEKPLATTLEEATALCELAGRLGLRLGASPITMFGAAQQLVARQLAARQLLGQVRAATATVLCGGWGEPSFRLGARGWKAHRRFGIGSLRDVGVYPIHMLAAWLGPVVAVSAFCADASHGEDGKTSSNGDLQNSKETETLDEAAVDCWTLTLRFRGGQVATVLSSLSLSAKSADEAYCLTLRGDRGALTLNAMWNGDSKMRFVPDGGDAGQGVSQELFPWRPPFVVKHGVSHPHVCNWAAGVEALVASLDEEGGGEGGVTEFASFTGERARHVVDVLERAEQSAAQGGRLQGVTSTFAWPLPMLDPHGMGAQRTLFEVREADVVRTCMASPIAFGTMRLAQAKNPMELLDSAWNMGCNTFDLGHVYGSQVECLFGKWMASRMGGGETGGGPGRLLRRVGGEVAAAGNTSSGVAALRLGLAGGPSLASGRRMSRRDLLLVGKGGHPFRNSQHKARLSSQELDKDLSESLVRLGTGYLDVFLLHRDDPARFPDVGAICRTMDAIVLSGRVRAWGVSNWSLDRIIALRECAKTHGHVLPQITSPQHSLAVPRAPLWDGIAPASSIQGTPAYGRTLLEGESEGGGGGGGKGRQATMAAVTWSPLAEGFLAGAEPSRQESKAAWCYAENEARRERLRMVAERHGTGAASAAIAFALATGATVVVVGCGSVEHLQDAVRGSTVGLVEEEVTFLKTGRVA